jgi:ribosomal protein L9
VKQNAAQATLHQGLQGDSLVLHVHVDDAGELHGGMDMQDYVDRVGKVKNIHEQVERMT